MYAFLLFYDLENLYDFHFFLNCSHESFHGCSPNAHLVPCLKSISYSKPLRNVSTLDWVHLFYCYVPPSTFVFYTIIRCLVEAI